MISFPPDLFAPQEILGGIEIAFRAADFRLLREKLSFLRRDRKSAVEHLVRGLEVAFAAKTAAEVGQHFRVPGIDDRRSSL